VRPHGALPLAKYAPRSGARVLDVGCSRGRSTIDLARLVGPKGNVVGLDACDARLALAHSEASAAALTNVAFVRGDAETIAFDDAAGFDLCFVRLGTRSFQAPGAVLRNVRRALVRGGRLLLVTWRSLALNPWAAIPLEIALRHRVRARLPELAAALVFMDDPDVAQTLLERAGYADIRSEAIDAPLVVGSHLDEVIARHLDDGPSEPERRDVIGELRGALSPFVTSRGVVMPSSAWCITATSPS
jgi:SAM-dependent methyltransferase